MASPTPGNTSTAPSMARATTADTQHQGETDTKGLTTGNTSTAPSMARATTAKTQRQGGTNTQGHTTGNTSTAPSMARAGNADSQYQRETNRKGHRPTHLSGHDTGGAERDTLTKHNARGETTTNKRRLSLDPQENPAKKTNIDTTHQPKKTTLFTRRDTPSMALPETHSNHTTPPMIHATNATSRKTVRTTNHHATNFNDDAHHDAEKKTQLQ